MKTVVIADIVDHYDDVVVSDGFVRSKWNTCQPLLCRRWHLRKWCQFRRPVVAVTESDINLHHDDVVVRSIRSKGRMSSSASSTSRSQTNEITTSTHQNIEESTDSGSARSLESMSTITMDPVFRVFRSRNDTDSATVDRVNHRLGQNVTHNELNPLTIYDKVLPRVLYSSTATETITDIISNDDDNSNVVPLIVTTRSNKSLLTNDTSKRVNSRRRRRKLRSYQLEPNLSVIVDSYFIEV